ncbi:nitric oxide synthase oxygenase [Cytobacillus kochii]|uniref:nitric oxide synthase oxygenase n=1 Tax=Cytobacillus kochii TaxID=859143 RepID=UPI0025A1FD43|nr:nitric oxide synthase oxygenase [Cytobacillus kochii]MDM5207403.1 nitric oxide synthase oxygenase [Cytobacillus kochii]
MSKELFQKAQEFIYQFYEETRQSKEQADRRLSMIFDEIESTGTYTQLQEELAYGSKLAWRNSNRCIGRFFWETLQVIDKRLCKTEEEVAKALFEHIKLATNSGKIKPFITVFPSNESDTTFRLWNHQLIRYAGYDTKDGILGDSSSIEFTKKCIELGWEPTYSRFDILPLVIQKNNEEPKWFTIPTELIVEVEIEHPEYTWFKELQLKWYGIPIIADMKMEIGGLIYEAAPFNGWYMGTEIGARNLADEERYNQLPIIAEMLELNIRSNASLWKDRALVELNLAVMHSFRRAGVSIVDHHTAAEQFKQFETKERKHKREVTGDWTWLIPPLSPATTHIFHKPYKNVSKSPNYYYQHKPY